MGAMKREHFTPLAPQLAHRMALLAALTLIVMGGLAPWLYEKSQRVELQ